LRFETLLNLRFNMIIFIPLIVVSLSFIGIIAFTAYKLPYLRELPDLYVKKEKFKKVLAFFKKAGEFKIFKDFSFESFLQKSILKLKILSLKTENRTASWLQKLREKKEKGKPEAKKKQDNYWKGVKTYKKKRKEAKTSSPR